MKMFPFRTTGWGFIIWIDRLHARVQGFGFLLRNVRRNADVSRGKSFDFWNSSYAPLNKLRRKSKILFLQVPLPQEQSISTCHSRMSTEKCYCRIFEYDQGLILPYCSLYVYLDHYIGNASCFSIDEKYLLDAAHLSSSLFHSENNQIPPICDERRSGCVSPSLSLA